MKPRVHFTDNYLVNPTNPIFVNLIGAGGTGSQVLSSLGRINASLLQLGHPGLFVRLFDSDKITPANMGRQLFAASETGLFKSHALINRINRFFGTNWKGYPVRYSALTIAPDNRAYYANMTISCVDNVQSRFEIAELLQAISKSSVPYDHDCPSYWMDFGNSRHTGQVLLSTVSSVSQPKSKQFQTVGKLPYITDEYRQLLEQTQEDNEPSCSLAEALEKQDLFINSAMAAVGSSLLWRMFREGMTQYRGFFLNLKDYRSQPIPV